MGSGAVFLNSDYGHYLLGDSNPDLINLFQCLKEQQNKFIVYCSGFFTEEKNSEDWFYKYRTEFNKISQGKRKAALFLYLNRHCYNGLCRYNSRSEFNTPFGRYKKPYFPKKEMQCFIELSVNAEFITANFDETMKQAKPGDVVYCDPPYAPLTNTAYFTDYHVGGFNWDDQMLLAEMARTLAANSIQVLISNHNTREIRKLYKGAKLYKFEVQRTISCKGNNRRKADELLAVF